MPHSAEDKKKALMRLRRIRGQGEGLERAIEAGTECSLLLQQISALRGAVGGLMAEILESHLKETFGKSGKPAPAVRAAEDMENIIKILRTYLK